jgi:short-subunit dehydrogenase
MNEYALITGASKGIGKSMARLLAGRGYNVMLVARSAAELEELSVAIEQEYQVKAVYLAVDLTEQHAAREVADWCKQHTSALAILINNAGFGLWGNFAELDYTEQAKMLQLNVNRVVELSHLLLPVLQQQKQAYILNVASTAAYQSLPTLAIYAATKSFILFFSRALQYELKDGPVSVSCLCPGPTDTAFASRAGMDALAHLADKFNVSPDVVAAAGINGMFKKKIEIIPGLINKLSAFGGRHLPKRLVEKISAGLYLR